jgi:pimeloyl-ACP methyl ester carboxylesterase
MQRTVHTPDGRLLAVEDRGDPAGRPVLVHHGTPNSKLVIRYGLYERDAAERGLRLISYGRPGYGESSPQPGRTVADTAADVRMICTQLGINRLATWGHSGGGPHVLACAALLPDLVTAAASLASLAPFDAEGLDYYAGMGQGNVDDTRLFLTDEAATRKKLDQDREEILAASPDDVARGRSSRRSRRQMRPSRSGPASSTSSFCLARKRGWRRAARDGGTTTACSGRGDSTSPTSLSRSCYCTAGRTCCRRPATANGSLSTFPASRPGCSTMMGTRRW